MNEIVFSEKSEELLKTIEQEITFLYLNGIPIHFTTAPGGP